MTEEEEKQALRAEIDARLMEMLIAACQEEWDEEERLILYGTGGEPPKGILRVKAK